MLERSAEESALHRHLTFLVERYEAVRFSPGEPRYKAERALGLALARSGPIRIGDVVWSWSHVDDSITRRRAPSTNHPHGRRPGDEAIEMVPQSSRRQCGRVPGGKQTFGGWTIKGRSL